MDKADVIYIYIYTHMYICMYIYVYTHTHTHGGTPFSHEKEQIFAICSNMDGLGGHFIK